MDYTYESVGKLSVCDAIGNSEKSIDIIRSFISEYKNEDAIIFNKIFERIDDYNMEMIRAFAVYNYLDKNAIEDKENEFDNLFNYSLESNSQDICDEIYENEGEIGSDFLDFYFYNTEFTFLNNLIKYILSFKRKIIIEIDDESYPVSSKSIFQYLFSRMYDIEDVDIDEFKFIIFNEEISHLFKKKLYTINKGSYSQITFSMTREGSILYIN